MRVEADNEEAQRDWLVRELRSHMRKLPKRRQLTGAARQAQALFEANAARLPSDHLACGPGCASCCIAHVGVEMAEAFVILDFLRATRDEATVADLLAAIAERAKAVGGLDPAARWAARVPCILLDGQTGNCTIYDVRPLACRGYTSTDRGACEAMAESGDTEGGIPADGERLGRSRLVRQALARATVAAAGSDAAAEHLELHTALARAAESGDALAWQRELRRMDKAKTK